jgi:hypothetical protein
MIAKRIVLPPKPGAAYLLLIKGFFANVFIDSYHQFWGCIFG